MKRISLIMMIVAALTLTWLMYARSQTQRTSTLSGLVGRGRKRTSMKKYAVVLCAFTLLVIALSSAGSRATKTEIDSSPAPTPTPTAVTGTELHDNVAYIKPGYKFINRGDAVDVMPERGRFKTGTYICPCDSKDRTKKCEMVFTTRRITCRSGSCGSGSCLLSAAAPTAQQ